MTNNIDSEHYLRLGVNIDHVATVRNARGGFHPQPLRAAIMAQHAGADGITAHLREDRRHISDQDIIELKHNLTIPLNLEMAATEEMLSIALKTVPNAVCIVPEKRQEITTEGGLNILAIKDKLKEYIIALQEKRIRVSLFIEPDLAAVELAAALGADIIEFHTGKYSHLSDLAQQEELQRIIAAANLAQELSLESHAGHGLNYDNVKDIANIKLLKELNIGHFLMGEAMFTGLDTAIKNMRRIINDARVL